MDYTEKHSKALAKIQARRGVQVTLTSETPSSFNAETDELETTPVSVKCYAIELPGDPNEYATNGLTESDPATLFIVPVTYGERPRLHSVVEWAGRERVVRRLFPYQPDGTFLAARVLVV